MKATVRVLPVLFAVVLLTLGNSPSGPQAETRAQGAANPAWRVPVDISEVTVTYSNFSRVTGTPEELVIDFGLNDQGTTAPKVPIKAQQRIVLSYYSAKRLSAALQIGVERHEELFGELELDVQRRMRNRRKAD
ncbi:MAG: DUF3467 domain-containing protein [Planctomycetes bacterium]|nr:DUF3467 domain-containing protein [Planctomycetota bacterium]MBL7038676.1 DUF3467 domain-containing protein [Pirellulaceae bacterium]